MMNKEINYEIKNWNDIKDEFQNSNLIIGNGASIALHEGFNFRALKELAEMEGLFKDENILKLFDKFDTKGTGNFELILEFLWHAKLVNDCLEIDNPRIKNTYELVKNALIQSVQRIHCNYEGTVEPRINELYEFTSQFKNILSLNYDLLLYWIVMYGNKEVKDKHEFRDGWIYNRFCSDIRFLRNVPNHRDKISLVFYPHGNLVLMKSLYGQESKIEKGRKTLQRILDHWSSEKFRPLFVSEGTKQEKINTITSSPYLSLIYENVIPSLLDEEPRIVIYGWSLGDQDEHILEQFFRKKGQFKDKKIFIAISVRKSSVEKNCKNFEEKIRKYYKEAKVIFFDSQSSGCWNNP